MGRTSDRNKTVENFSTLPYDPPDVFMTISKGRSRLVDIWSFGCVLLESVIWLFFGVQELLEFKRRTIPFGSLYWTYEGIHNKTAKLNELTFAWIDQLLQHDPECKASERGSAMRDFILLITGKLLMMKLPEDTDVYEEGCRINNKTLVKELDAIIQKGERDPLYLFSGIT